MLELRKNTVVNDVENYPMVMEISFMYDSEVYFVGGYYEGDCLDNFADYCYENGLMGAFIWSEDALEMDDVVIVGNLGHVMNLNDYSIKFKEEK